MADSMPDGQPSPELTDSAESKSASADDLSSEVLLERGRAMLAGISEAADELEDRRMAERAERRHRIDLAQRRMQAAADLSDKITTAIEESATPLPPAQRDELLTLKSQLLDAYFSLGRRVEKVHGGAAESPSRAPPPVRGRPAVHSRPKTVPKAKSGRLSIWILGCFALLTLSWRSALWWMNREDPNEVPKMEQKRNDHAAIIDTGKSGKVRYNINTGVPVIGSVFVMQAPEGTLRATVVVVDAKESPRVSYKWYRDGTVIDNATEARLAADAVQPLATYKVAVRASNRNGDSDVVTSPALVAAARPEARQ